MDVLGGLRSRCRRGAGLGLGLWFGSGLRPWCVDGFGWLLGGRLGFRLGCGRGLRRGMGLGGGGGACDGNGFGGLIREVFLAPFGGGVVDEDVVVAADEVLVVVEVVESEAEEIDVGDGRGSSTVGAGTRCWVLWVMMTRVRVRASGVCAHFSWCPVGVPVLVLWLVSCVVRGGVVALFRLRG